MITDRLFLGFFSRGSRGSSWSTSAEKGPDTTFTFGRLKYRENCSCFHLEGDRARHVRHGDAREAKDPRLDLVPVCFAKSLVGMPIPVQQTNVCLLYRYRHSYRSTLLALVVGDRDVGVGDDLKQQRFSLSLRAHTTQTKPFSIILLWATDDSNNRT